MSQTESPARSRGTGWGRAQGVVLVAAVALVGVGGAPSRGHTAPLTSIVVRTVAGSDAAVQAAVARLGGHVGRQLPLVGGFAATIPGDQVGRLSAVGGVVQVTQDIPLRLFTINGYDNAGDANSLYDVTRMTGAQRLWSSGYTGKGIGVALIDTGTVPVNGLTTAGKVINGPDLSFDSQSPRLANLDGYGHGTHMAGIIAGRDTAAVTGAYAGDSSDFIGMAPDASILSVRVADHTGAADVSQVIAAIDWVVQHRNDNGMNVRVMNLSFGTDSNQAYNLDPLAFAAEQAWRQGIVVVAAAGNFGSSLGHLTDPATDPYLIAVGAADTRGTASTSDDTVASFSSRGDGTRNPDVVAPGVHMTSLRDPGSYLDAAYGSTATVASRFFRGSGTSQATAVVSGAAALVLSAHPDYTPDQVKRALMESANPLSGQTEAAQGAGEISLEEAISLDSAPRGDSAQTWAASSGSGTLQGARGSVVLTANNVSLNTEQDIMGHAWNSTAMASAEYSATSWSGGTWNGSGWSGSGWSGSGWSGSGWSGSGWSGSGWSGSGWSASRWSGSGWSGSGWSGSGWSGSGWSGSGWSGSGWSGSGWSGSGWSGSGWSGSGWSGSGWSGAGWAGSSWA